MQNGFAGIFLYQAWRQGAEGNYSAQTRGAILLDARDGVTPVPLSQSCLTVLALRGKTKELVVKPDREHVIGIDSKLDAEAVSGQAG